MILITTTIEIEVHLTPLGMIIEVRVVVTVEVTTEGY